jgi:hypothetical protein
LRDASKTFDDGFFRRSGAVAGGGGAVIPPVPREECQEGIAAIKSLMRSSIWIMKAYKLENNLRASSLLDFHSDRRRITHVSAMLANRMGQTDGAPKN